jgi:integrase
MNLHHSKLNSILDLDIDKAEKEWIWYLDNFESPTKKKGAKLTKQDGRHSVNYTFLRAVYSNLLKLTDTRDVWDKDRWNVDELKSKYGICYNASSNSHNIDFSKINNFHFKILLKNYMKFRLLGGSNFSWATAIHYGQYLTSFFVYLNSIEPEWRELTKLSRSHIENYIEFIRLRIKNRKNSNSTRFRNTILSCLSQFLKDIQRMDYKEAPSTPCFKLIFKEDFSKNTKKSDDDIDYIPEFVLNQLFENLEHLQSEIQPIIWISFKTGLRISDTLGLKQDCLICLNGKYSIRTDIEKTYVKGHKIPIDEHMAQIIAVLIEESKARSNYDNNPEKYIFVRYKGVRKGKPYSQGWVRETLNELAVKKQIKDESGNLYHFKIHQFRHTFAVKMLNSGVDILVVQDLLAHASPEMTMRYARLLEDTKRKAFEQAVNNGVFTFDLNGEIHNVQEGEEVPKDILEMLWTDEKLNAVDNPYGTCHARVNGNCPVAKEPPCLTANDGKPCFDLAVGTTSFDVKKYELWIESTSKVIEAAKEYGRPDVIEHNQKNLQRYQEIYNTIKNGNIIFGRIDRIKKKVNESGKKGV